MILQGENVTEQGKRENIAPKIASFWLINTKIGANPAASM